MHLANNGAAPRFFPLDAARNGRQPIGLRTTTTTPARPMRSDTAALNNGFFRIDRRTAVPLATQPNIPPASSTARLSSPMVIRNGKMVETPRTASAPVATPVRNNAAANDPILALFDATQEAMPSSFRDALQRGGSTAPSTGKHRWPLPTNARQKVSSAYGYRPDPINQNASFHGGLDIAAATGTPVLASASGEVSAVKEDPLYGKSVSILHADGSESHYGHLASQSVRVGDKVAAGKTIGTVGATGRVTGAHLDYRLTQDGVTIDPQTVLAKPDNGIAFNAPVRKETPSRSERLIIVR